MFKFNLVKQEIKHTVCNKWSNSNKSGLYYTIKLNIIDKCWLR